MVARRVVFLGALTLQAALVVRGAGSDHRELAFRMFPEASRWRADIVRVTDEGRRVQVSDAEWRRLVRGRGLSNPSVRHHADAGLDSQLAFLDAALDWFAARTPGTRAVIATVTVWHNDDPPRVLVLRSDPA